MADEDDISLVNYFLLIQREKRNSLENELVV